MEHEEKTVPAWEDAPEIQPEGGLEDGDLHDEFVNDANLFAEEESTSNPSGAEAVPTPEQQDAGAQSEAAPTTEPEESSLPQKLRFKAKIDRKEEDAEIDISELPGIYQRSRNYERMQQRYQEQSALMEKLDELSRQLGFETPQALLDHAQKTDRDAKIQELVNGGTPQVIAEDYVDRKIANTRKKPEQKAPQKDDSAYFKEQVEALFLARPDLRGKLQKLPEEVSQAVILHGTPLRTAYAEWESKQMKAENERIRREKDAFAQQAETASRAPVRGTTDHAPERQAPPDPLLSAFRDDGAW